MTPREPDRYEVAPDALERIAKAFEANPTAQHSGVAVASILRYLVRGSPAAAPAAEVKVNACQVDLRTDKDRECFDDIVQAATRVLRSEPAAPYDKWAATRGIAAPPAPLLPRVLAALEREADATTCAWFRSESQGLRSLAAELRAYIAEREPAEKRIAELEGALRDALNAAHHHEQDGQHWICSEPFACEEDCPCAKLAARAAPHSLPGDGSAET